MGSHPINLGIRFLLEIIALVSFGTWGWSLTPTWTRYLLAIVIPLSFALLWGTFAVPDDPSRSGAAPVVISGLLRLMLELSFFGLAAWAMYASGRSSESIIFAGIVILHYLLSMDRIHWLLSR